MVLFCLRNLCGSLNSAETDASAVVSYPQTAANGNEVERGSSLILSHSEIAASATTVVSYTEMGSSAIDIGTDASTVISSTETGASVIVSHAEAAVSSVLCQVKTDTKAKEIETCLSSILSDAEMAENANKTHTVVSSIEMGSSANKIEADATTIVSGASSSTPVHKKYEVFLSFRGEDTRKTFTSHLYAALKRNHLRVYIDDKSLETGDEISQALLSAIEESKLAIVIFSENYADSWWCLDELIHILQCKDRHKMLVLPIYYHVFPSEVRHQTERYANALSRLRKKDRMSQWINALTSASYLSGWEAVKFGLEADFVDAIVGDVIRKLGRTPPSVDFTGLIGIPQRLKDVESMLQLDSPSVRIIGIWGPGGVGKTELAKILYKQLSYQFDACCFLENVSDNVMMGGRGQRNLQDKLKAALFKGENLQEDDINWIFDKDRSKCKKVLICLDDVDNARQLDVIAGGSDWYGPGSRIILTSRNYRALDGSDEIYKCKELSIDEALQLFQMQAFKTTSSLTEEQIEWLRMVVHDYASCNPLALISLASNLRGTSFERWDGVLESLRKSPDPMLQKVLKLSYDKLTEMKTKNIFLDIACFFNEEEKEFVERILDGCGFSASDGIEDLIHMSLITEKTYPQQLSMSRLIKRTGREIVRAEHDEPGERSRLWNHTDLCHIFTHKSETWKIQGIFLDMHKIEMVEVSPAIFSKMSNLRLLKFHSDRGKCMLQFPRGRLELLPDALRYLYWDDYPFRSLPSQFRGNNLVEIKMQLSKAKTLWKGVQNLSNLIVFDLSFSKKLIEIPNLSGATNIQTVRLRGCKRVPKVPRYFKDLEKLATLDLEDCSSLTRVSALPMNVKDVNLQRCGKLTSLPNDIPTIHSLRSFKLNGCSSFDYNNNREILEFVNSL